jgi:exopolyphosphatase/guanosine-5'-triphosphate,3'-diphosphate pyrophosphatase
VLAAIDLGSNSFRLEVGRVRQGQYLQHHCRKEMVSLGAGFDAHGHLSGEAIDRGLRCLRIFAAELAELRPIRLRVVATQTLREARNRDEFLSSAEDTLGQPVEVISGHEEARLIFAGVAFMHPSSRRRLVIDIGGRSTEVIVGQARTPGVTESFRIGSASLSQAFFPDGRITAAGFHAAQLAVSAELGHALTRFTSPHWDEVMGSSGTAGTISTVLKENGITDGRLTSKGLRWLIDRCIEAGRVDRLELPGLKERRRAVLAGGLAILSTLIEHCGIRKLYPAKGALRQGVIIDLHENQGSGRCGHGAVPLGAAKILMPAAAF